jgi:phosphodiesterase/alkaline phosphatase D-like protein
LELSTLSDLSVQKMNFRQHLHNPFTGRFSIVFALCLLPMLAACAHGQLIFRGPIVGAVTDSSARVTIETSTPAIVAIEYSPSSDFSQNVRRSLVGSTTIANHLFTTVDLNELAPSQRYYLRPVINNKPDSFLTERSFRTFPTHAIDTGFTFCFGSCQMQAISKRRSSVFSQMRKVDPLLFLQIGDWAYPDEAIGANFANSDSLIARSYELKYDPTHGMDSLAAGRGLDYIYDDHDYVGNNADGTSPNKLRAVGAYENYFPHYPLPNTAAGLWHSFTVGNVEFLVLDLRSERSPNVEAIQQQSGSYAFAPPSGHSILRGTHTIGEDQKTWLLNSLKSSKARWKVIISSVTWNPSAEQTLPLLAAYANLKHDASKLYEAVDKWAGFPEDQDSILAFVKREGIKNIIVCSGDVHTGMMDDGAHSIFPEIVSANLERPNSNLLTQLDSVGFGKYWNRGGQRNDTTNTYGRITVLTSPKHALLLEVVNERDSVVAQTLVADSSSSAAVASAVKPREIGVELSDHATTVFAMVTIEKDADARVYIIDELGHEVRRIADGLSDGGTWKFQVGKTNLTSGMYFFVLESKTGQKWSKKFTVLK